MGAQEHGSTPNNFDGVGDEHHLTLGSRVSKGCDKGGQQYIREHKEKFEKRGHPVRGSELG